MTSNHKDLLQLLSTQDNSLSSIYTSLSKELAQVLKKYKITNSSRIWHKNKQVKKEVDAIMRRHQKRMLTHIGNKSKDAWDLSNNHNDSLVSKYTKGIRIPNPAVYNQRNEAALKAFLNRSSGGLKLSDRVWNLNSQTKSQMEYFIAEGLTEGVPAAKLATDVKRYLKEPNKRFRRIRDPETGKLKYSDVTKNYKPGRGVYKSSYKNALRLTRNEINIAYRTADLERRKQLDFVVGVKVQLSPAHPQYDICDEMVGDYPKDFNFVGWHPNCLCFTTNKLLSKKDFIAQTNGKIMPDSKYTKKIPKRAENYLNDNFDKINGLKNTPYFIKDNFETLNGKFKIGDPEVTKAIKAAQAKEFDTEKMFMKGGEYTPERQKLHKNILDDLMNSVDHSQTDHNYFLGGAPANGKSTLEGSGFLPHPKGMMTVNSDLIKEMLPEYQNMLLRGDSAAAAFVHEESSYLSKKLLEVLKANNKDFLLDGVNDGKYESLVAKIKKHKKKGKRLRADYVSLDTDLSVKLAKARAKKTGREVPISYIESANRDISKVVPRLLDDKIFDDLYLWDTNVNKKPRLILKQIDGKLTIHDRKLYDQFLAKQNHITKRNQADIDSLMKKAKDSAKEVDDLANQVAKLFDGYTTPLNLKGEESLARKLLNAYSGDIKKVKDAVRTTIIVDEDKIDAVLDLLGKNPKFTRIKRQRPEDFLGYSGSVNNLKTSRGIIGEIQVNTERMIFGKEKPADAKRILGVKRWNEIRKESGVDGGLGHIYYEEYRLLDKTIPAHKKRMQELEKLSRDYYAHFNKPKVKAKPKFTAAKTIEEAEKWALDNNLAPKVNYKNLKDVKVANTINKAVFEAKKYGVKYDKIFISNSRSKIGTFMSNVSVYRKGVLNQSHLTFNQATADYITDKLNMTLDQYILNMNKEKYLYGNTLEDMVNHEIGHHLTSFKTSKDYNAISRLFKFERYDISNYGMTNGFEALAEIWSAFKKDGKEALKPEWIEFFNKYSIFKI